MEVIGNTSISWMLQIIIPSWKNPIFKRPIREKPSTPPKIGRGDA